MIPYMNHYFKPQKIIMKLHTTNYQNTFIEVAEDCSATKAEAPPKEGDNKPVANLQFDLLDKQPY